MLARLCQLKSLFLLCTLLAVAACSWNRRDQYASELVTTFPNKWFSVSKNHTILNQDLLPVPHVYFDSTPQFELTDQDVNVVISTPEESEHAYALDLQSGQRYYSHSFCAQKDVWADYKGELFRPRFSIGHIPRVLDQLGEPQKVIIWSKRLQIREFAATNLHKVRLVGAYVEQSCPEGNCIGKSNWLSRLVFLAVDSEDPYYDSVKDIKGFQSVVNWREAKAMLGNMEGRNFRSDSTFPSTRVGELIDYKDAFEYFKKRSIFLSDKELKKIQKSCHGLYDQLWKDVGEVKPEDKPATTLEELDKKIKLHEELRKKQIPLGFAARFRAFTNKYFNEITTCEKFVYHGNINQDPERFWFLSFIGIYYRLHREGYYFDCNNKAWLRNVPDENGKPVYHFLDQLERCSEREIDQAMDYLPNFLAGLRGEKDYYKFIDYDNHTYGTHRKLYSWVRVKTRRFDCANDPNEKVRQETKVFPEDVVWKERRIKDIGDKMKIIY
jgi:hypothetical protein